MHNFFKSADFDEICKDKLPGNLGGSRPGCVFLGLMLSKMYKDWLALALQSVQRKSNPALFTQMETSNLSTSDENNEVNSFVGWSIFSALKRYEDPNDEDNESKRLLLSMIILEEDADDDYMTNYYGTNTSMVNCGGLTLVSKYFFGWGKDAMKVIRDSFTPRDMKQNLRDCFKNGKLSVMRNTFIRSKFESLCQSSPMSFGEDAIDEVYNIILPKMIHSRFAVVFRRWKEEHCQKHDVSLRSKLKASVDNNKSKQKPKRLAPEQPDDDESAIDVKKAKTS
jgi:hypothetical protein